MIGFGSVSGAVVYWLFITSFGVLLVGAIILELRRRGKPIRPWHAIAAGITVLGFAALAYTGVWRSFYSLERTAAGLELTYHWPSRRVVVPWDSIERINTAPGYKDQRPLRVIARDGRQHLSVMIGARDALRLSRCLGAEVAQRRGEVLPAGFAAAECR
ncbi:MAG: hypothetical protein ACREOF_18925 [Gemmatimonadales bacterium]